MMLTSSNEIILAVVEGNMLFWGCIAVSWGLAHAIFGAVEYVWTAVKRRRRRGNDQRSCRYGRKP